MNCFNLDPARKGLSHGIPVAGIDGISLGGTNIVMFGSACQSDLARHFKEMTLNDQLVDADLSGGEIVPRREASNNTLVRLKLLPSWGTERLYKDGQIAVSGLDHDYEVDHVLGPARREQPYAPARSDWTDSVHILISLPSKGGGAAIRWTTVRIEGCLWWRHEVVETHLATLTMESGKPVFKRRAYSVG